MALFAGLVILFLQRSTAAEPRDHMYQYLVPAVGCATANYVGNHTFDPGNHSWEYLAWALIVGVIGYVLVILKPFNQAP